MLRDIILFVYSNVGNKARMSTIKKNKRDKETKHVPSIYLPFHFLLQCSNSFFFSFEVTRLKTIFTIDDLSKAFHG